MTGGHRGGMRRSVGSCGRERGRDPEGRLGYGVRRERQRARATAARRERHGEHDEARMDCAATTDRERQGLSR
jgi:hypothetical protein